jgi:hypothetical protein
MNSHREVPMLRMSSLAAALAAVLATGGCDLNVENPNAPDKNRAFGDPAGLQQLLGGAFRTWVEARDGYFVMPLTTMADNYTASWNNASIRFYASVGSDCAVRCGWTNSSTAAEAAGGPAIEAQWYGYYTVLSSASDVLRAIDNGICFDDDCVPPEWHRATPGSDSTLTVRNKAIAKMLQGMTFAGIALIYDQGFVVDETTVLPENPADYPAFNNRAAVRDAALQKLEQAYTLAGPGTWSTEPEWMGVGSGTAYTNAQIRKVIRTMQAELVAMWPRNSTENGAADWAQVATYASQGVSSGTPFDWQFYIDLTARDAGIEWVKSWGNSIGTMRVDTRVAKLLDPLSQEDPWPDGLTTAKSNPVTRVTAAITGSGSPQTVTPLTMPASLTAGRLLAIECSPFDVSCVGDRFVVTGTTATTFTAVITQSYSAPTTLSAAVTKDTLANGNPKSVAATPASMAGIDTASFLWIDDPSASNELVTVDSVTATRFYAKFRKNHTAGAVVAAAIHRNGGDPGNWCPLTSPDLRVGDGSYGPSDDFNGFSTLAKTANAGTDYACSGVAIFPAARGQYHQSNMQHVRYEKLGGVGENLGGDGTGQDPFYTRQMNDLLWAEGLIERPTPDFATAAGLINNSRVVRGGLPALTGGETKAQLLAALRYEQEIEFMGQGATAFFNRRRIDGLIPSTPRQMPVPAKELDVLLRSVYTFGGPNEPDMVSGVDGGSGRAGRQTVVDRWRELQALKPAPSSRRRS